MQVTEENIRRELEGQTSPEESRELLATLEKAYRTHRDTRVERPLRDMEERIRQRRQLRWWRATAVAAVLVLAAGVGVQLLHRQGQVTAAVERTDSILPGRTCATLRLANGRKVELGADSTHNAQVLQAMLQTTGAPTECRENEVTVPRGGEFKVVLEDGTTVWLNADSHLTYPESFTDGERRVRVDGEAYFEVARDESRPFVVETAGQLVRVLGTEFNIHSYADEPDVLTTLVKGSIAMSPADRPDAEVRLTPDHQASFGKQSHEMRIRQVDAEALTAWREGIISFSDQTLEDIMRTLARWYDFDYTFADRQAARTEFVGQVTRYDNFDDVCRILEKCGGISIARSGRHIKISTRR